MRPPGGDVFPQENLAALPHAVFPTVAVLQDSPASNSYQPGSLRPSMDFGAVNSNRDWNPNNAAAQLVRRGPADGSYSPSGVVEKEATGSRNSTFLSSE